MKKTLLLLLICVAATSMKAQINLVNDSYFINTGITDTIVGPATTFPGMGYWYPYLTSNNQGKIYITPESGRNNRNAAGIKIATTNVGSWTRGLAQRVAAPDNGIYRVGFWGKFSSVASGQISTYIRVFLRIDPTANIATPLYFSRSGAANVTRDIFVTSSWAYYYVDFDLSKKATKDAYTESFATTNDDIADFALTISNFKQSYGGDIQITGVTMTKVDNTATPATWYNPGFEQSYAVPYLLLSSTGNPIRAQETTTKGNWVLALMDGITDPTKSQATVLADSTQAYTGRSSLKLDVKYVRDFSKVCLATTLFNLPKDDYVFSFYAKTDIDAVPFRVDVDNYNIEKSEAKKGFPFSDQATIKENQISSTGWTKYEVHFNNTDMSDTLSIAIRPNITVSGSPVNGAEDWSYTEVTYWFDDFSIVKDFTSDNISISNEKDIKVITTGRSVQVMNVKKAVELIDLNGRVLDRRIPQYNEVNFNLNNNGIFILRTEGVNKKIVVR